MLRAPRPDAGEFFGLYLVDKKVGWYFTTWTGPARRSVRSIADFVFQAMVGDKIAERRHTRSGSTSRSPAGSSSPSSSTTTETVEPGDGRKGHAPTGFTVRRKRPGHVGETLTLPPVEETVEVADQLRVALLRGKEVSGMALDGTDLGQYRMTTTPVAEERRVVNGVPVLLRKATIVSEKEKVPTRRWWRRTGRWSRCPTARR